MAVQAVSSRASRAKQCPSCGALESVVKVGFAEAIEGREQDFPILALALQNAALAVNPMIEWVRNGVHAANYCQIIRTPFGATGTEEAARLYGGRSEPQLEADALTAHLETVERILTFGEPGEDFVGNKPRRMCGGVRYYLGRLPREGDTVRLRPLRDLVLLTNRQPPDLDGFQHEWLCEISLQVDPA